MIDDVKRQGKVEEVLIFNQGKNVYSVETNFF